MARRKREEAVERIPIDPERPDEAPLRRAADVVRRGGVVAYPTETFYGLGVDPFDGDAWERVLRLKGRRADKALPLALSEKSQLASVCDAVPAAVERLAEVFWPGPLTLVVPARRDLGGGLRGVRTVAVRVSGLPVARELARWAEGPITATSANRAGDAPADRPAQVEKALGHAIDLMLDGGTTAGGAPSTIVDITHSPPRLVRPGKVSFDAVLDALEQAGLLDGHEAQS